MAAVRTVEIFIDADSRTKLEDMLIKAVGREKAFPQLNAAIGYLSTWNLNYPIVKIWRGAGADLDAAYFDADRNRQYVIGAVWHDDHYGFHS